MLVNTDTDASGAGDQGAVSVEFALTVGAFVVVFVTLLMGLQAVVAQIRLNHATASAATWLARGESLSEVQHSFEQMAPATASLSVTEAGDWVVVSGTTAAPSLLGKVLPPLRAQYQVPKETRIEKRFEKGS